ncbi:MAG: membrane protein insertion efficiency factor YidD [Burkholderiaceae bacterium]
MSLAPALISTIKGYRFFLSPWLGNACRFSPTCSEYSIRAIEAHGAALGVYLAFTRIARCHPWCEGGEDDVPVRPPRWSANAPTTRPRAAVKGTVHVPKNTRP